MGIYITHTNEMLAIYLLALDACDIVMTNDIKTLCHRVVYIFNINDA